MAEVIATPGDTIVVQNQATPVITSCAPTVVVRGRGTQGPPGPVGPIGVAGPPGAGGTNESQSGIAAVTLSGHRVVTPQADGTLIYADNATIAHRDRPLWITMSAYTAGDLAQAISHGLVTEPSWSWTPGQVYLGANGALTQTPPAGPAAAFLAVVGEAFGATQLFVTRLPSIILA